MHENEADEEYRKDANIFVKGTGALNYNIFYVKYRKSYVLFSNISPMVMHIVLVHNKYCFSKYNFYF